MYGDITIESSLTLEEKLQILSDAAKYDVACTSSGVDRRGRKGFIGNSCAAGICHTFAADGRCVSLLKILMTNHCVYDCKYCQSRRSNDIPRATFTPEEICNLTIEFYKRNYIEGLFLSSGVIQSPAYTMERMCEALRMLRTTYRFNGYIHIKAIPGAPAELIYSAGLLADRVSINMELPTEEGLRSLAPNKTMKTIMTPMSQVAGTIAAHRLAIGKDARMERSTTNRHLTGGIFNQMKDDAHKKVLPGQHPGQHPGQQHACFPEQRNSHNPKSAGSVEAPSKASLSEVPSSKAASPAISPNDTGIILPDPNSAFQYPADPRDTKLKRPFAAAGQSTQIIVGATQETDLQLIRMSQKLYQGMDLKRVFYSAYVPLNEDSALPSPDTAVPLLREHRLYQSDWLLRFYGFEADELLSEENPNFDERIDPKAFWALTHLNDFPVEVNTASFDTLLRVPGIGPKSVMRIVNTRRYSALTFDMLKKMGVVLKRAQYFITCGGRMLYRIPMDQRYITDCLAGVEHADNYRIRNSGTVYTQMNLFTDFGIREGTV